MMVKDIIDEDYQDYKKTSMMIATCLCDWKCLTETGLSLDICQNSELAKQKNIDVSIDLIVNRYIKNPLTQAVVFGGLEPMLQFNDIFKVIQGLRMWNNDDIVIYTGYYPEEIQDKIETLKQFSNIIVKYGRFIPDSVSKFDDVLGVQLSSANQFAVKIS